MNKSVTYIIVTWNNENEIENCLKTLFEFSPSDSKVIVVDNNSSDKTVELISSHYPNVNLISSKENLGFAKANNVALNHVETDFICYLNPDVILTEDFVTDSMLKLNEFPEIGIVAARLKNVDLSHQQSTFNFATSKTMFIDVLHLGKLMPKFLKRKYGMSAFYPENDFYPDWVIGAEMVLRTADAKAVNGFSTEYFMYTEDMDLCKKVLDYLNKKTYYLSSKSLIHIGGASEVQNVSYDKQKKMFENTILFVEKFYSKIETKKTVSNMILAYTIRLLLLKFFYKRYDKKNQIDKTSQALLLLKELKQ
ncbi:glycosyltransferase family 2 protein [Streptococcus uberis]|uniref:glycosyltransferase family 2 protein n=1 Tax=Streptococcus uberis TaxID=1349 RepID=UPI001939FFB5|nr:glycosyltransferase family 2 protein [Streptococcus uberis]MCR4253521.1 glycosyltransferase family 2 protein [Streptococcus uberis]MCR4255499.1 glycosyltransferase family 2 protein [Streptococcus uberis]MCR4260197.1 glycosyltransferase family 2 protein [Streptococcus uberis]MCR4262564.1 glycosyltransferase family 2 protein [Streptococcus uberis]